MNKRFWGIVLTWTLFAAGSVFAQSYQGDARQIAMGGAGYSDNIATSMIEEERPYTSIALPLGIIQILQDMDRFDPDDKEKFDPVLALEYAANPMHYTFKRDPGGARSRFISNTINGELSRDLNDYRGIDFPDRFEAEGLVAPNWGKTFKFHRSTDGPFQGVYVGAGPYFSAGTDLEIDRELRDVLASSTPVSISNRNFNIANQSIGQLAMAITGGYRARFKLPGAMKSGRDGLYIGMNYNYLYGFQYLDSAISVRMDTDAAGLLTLNPATVPLDINYYNSGSGRGFSLDFGAGVVVNRWEFGFGANGVENRIDWRDLKLKNYTLQNLLDGGDFIEQELPADPSETTVELPVRYTGNIGYHRGRYHVVTEGGHGFHGYNFRGGIEFGLAFVDFRGGVRYSREQWNPTGGVGINFCKSFSLDVAAFGSSANLENRRLLSIAMSLRFNRAQKD